MQSPGGAKPRARECQAGDGGRIRHEPPFLSSSMWISLCCAASAVQAMRSKLCAPS